MGEKNRFNRRDQIVADLNMRGEYGPSFELTAEQYGKMLKERVLSEFETEDYHDYLRKIESEKHSRVLRKDTADVVEIESHRFDEQPPLIYPGSVTIFWGEKGGEFIQDLKEAIQAEDSKTISEISERIQKEISSRSLQGLGESVGELLSQDVFFDIKYGDKTIGPNMTLTEDVRFGSLTLPYNGGELDKKFKIVEYRDYESSEGDFPYEVLVVVNTPRLSEIEKKALSEVPRSVSESNIGTSAVCGAATIFVVMVATWATCTLCDPLRDELLEVAIPEETLERLGPVASAQELVKARRELMEQYGA